MKVKLYILAMFLLITTQLEGTIRYVPGDYNSIQQAINASINGDTVLVASDTYYENINFNGKNIVVGSQYLTTNDTSYISQTIIDGSETGSVVTISSSEDSTALLAGFTIRNGKAMLGGGIYVKDTSPRISHCIITNNTAESSNGQGGGIFLWYSRSTVSNCEIKSNSAIGMDTNNGWGGGIAVVAGEVTIVNCIIRENHATSSYGGIGASNTVIKLIGCVITKNSSYGSAGIGFQDTEAYFINSTLANNKSSGAIGGLYFIRSSPVIQNSIIWYNTISSGFDNIDGWGGTPDISYSNVQGGFESLEIMDLEPMFQDTTSGNFQLTSSSPCIDAGDPDTTGLDLPPYDLNGNYRIWDGNEDGTLVIDMGAYEYGSQSVGIIQHVPGDYNSIQQAIDASTNGDTVLVASNTYYENINFNGKNIVVGSQYLTTNDTSYISQTIIDGSETGSVVIISSNENSTAMLTGFTIRNGKASSGGGIYVKDTSPRISHCIIINNTAESSNGQGGGVVLRDSRSTVSNCEIKSNSAIGMDTNNGLGGGIAVVGGEVRIINCTIHENYATSSWGGIGASNTVIKLIGCVITKNSSYGSAGIGFQDAEAYFINSTLANNKSSGATGGFYFIRSSPVIRNSIIWYNTSSSGFDNIDGWGGTPDISYSNVQGGFESLEIMDLEPMFQDTTSGNFQLTSSSPCIDAGDPDTTGLNLPPYDLNGNVRIWDGNEDGTPVIDMGAYEYGSQLVGIKEQNQTYIPENYQLLQNYPNPFNSETVFFFSLPKHSLISLKIYNIAGQEITTLTNDYYETGTHQIKWAAYNQPTGVYICQIVTDDYVQSIKLILQK